MSDKLPSKGGIENLFEEVKSVIDNARDKVYQLANFTVVESNWNIGRKIVEEEQEGNERAEYGKYLIEGLSKRLTEEYGRGYTTTNLWYMRQFYNEFGILHSLRGELSWTHYRMLLKVVNESARSYYMNSAADERWSTRDLQRQLNTQYYERMISNGAKDIPSIPFSKDELEYSKPSDVIKDPVVLEFLGIKENEDIRESELESALVNQLQSFLLELGKGFSFVGRQYRLTAETEHFYVDLVFYNYILKCFVLIDLKTTKLTHEAIGQMDFYVRYFEDQIKVEGDNPTIGLILCAEKNNAIAKYSLLSESKQIFASQYKTYLPSIEDLQKEISRGRHQIELEKKLK